MKIKCSEAINTKIILINFFTKLLPSNLIQEKQVYSDVQRPPTLTWTLRQDSGHSLTLLGGWMNEES